MSANPEDYCYLSVDPFLLSGNRHLFGFSMFLCSRKWYLCAKVRICLSPARIQRPSQQNVYSHVHSPISCTLYRPMLTVVLRAMEIYTLHHTCSTFSWSPVPVRHAPSAPSPYSPRTPGSNQLTRSHKQSQHNPFTQKSKTYASLTQEDVLKPDSGLFSKDQTLAALWQARNRQYLCVYSCYDQLDPSACTEKVINLMKRALMPDRLHQAWTSSSLPMCWCWRPCKLPSHPKSHDMI